MATPIGQPLTSSSLTPHRSPWSNQYFPAIDDGFLPSEKLRAMEMEANELFDSYRELYFEGGTSSVYLWDLDNGFAGCFLIKKRTSFPHRFPHLPPQISKAIAL
jgi:hypothetical protein